jgi:hypothetical protein
VAGAGVVGWPEDEEPAQGSKPPSMATQAAMSASGFLHKQSRVLNCKTFFTTITMNCNKLRCLPPLI